MCSSCMPLLMVSSKGNYKCGALDSTFYKRCQIGAKFLHSLIPSGDTFSSLHCGCNFRSRFFENGVKSAS